MILYGQSIGTSRSLRQLWDNLSFSAVHRGPLKGNRPFARNINQIERIENKSKTVQETKQLHPAPQIARWSSFVICRSVMACLNACTCLHEELTAKMARYRGVLKVRKRHWWSVMRMFFLLELSEKWQQTSVYLSIRTSFAWLYRINFLIFFGRQNS